MPTRIAVARDVLLAVGLSLLGFAAIILIFCFEG